MDHSRRKFIKVTSLASFSTLPVVKALGNVLEMTEDKIINLESKFNSDFEFHIIDNNLLNLHFYFINVKKSGSSLISASANTSLKSFMIVRLPQMHVSEKGYWEDDWKEPKKIPPYAKLSGYSYLAFQLWPDKIVYDKDGKEIQRTTNSNKKLRFTLENILNWNAENNFNLITLIEWFELKDSHEKELEFVNLDRDKKETCPDFAIHKVYKEPKIDLNEKPIQQSESYEPSSKIYKKYKSLINTFLDKNLIKGDGNNKFIPITLLEVPQGISLVPIARDENGTLAEKNKKPKKIFWQNKFTNQERADFGFRKYEVWNNTLFYKSEIQNDSSNSEKKFKIISPSFRVVGLIGEYQCPKPTAECEEDCKQQKDKNILPSLLDKTELAFLTQYAKDFTTKDFDINEVNGLFFTGLGVITHLKYYNVENRPKGIDLIEYEHVITQGRDVFIKVSRLGYNSKTGQKYKHVIEGKRKIKTHNV